MSHRVDIQACANSIECLQRADGAIPWIDAGIWDAWNHGESVMALAIAGRRTAVLKGLDCLLTRQEADGAWTGDLGASVPLDSTNRKLVVDNPDTARDINFTGYCAVTVMRSLLALEALDQLPRYWPMLQAAIRFVLEHQTVTGDIVWRARDDAEALEDIDSLRAGNASLYKALECAILAARLMGFPADAWIAARQRLGAVLRENDARFDRQGTDRRRYAMDWYYPVLAGVMPAEAGRARLYARWTEFVTPGLGCRCVSDEPWVTAAETAELALACLSVGKRDQAAELISNLEPLAADQGGYWMGWQFEEQMIWPQERPGWTAGALVLAEDALHGTSPGSALLTRVIVPERGLSSGGEALPSFLRA